MLKAFSPLFVALLLTSISTSAATPTLPLGNDLADIVRFDADIFPDARAILESMQAESEHNASWFDGGAYTQIAFEKASSPTATPTQRWRGPVALQSAQTRT